MQRMRERYGKKDLRMRDPPAVGNEGRLVPELKAAVSQRESPRRFPNGIWAGILHVHAIGLLPWKVHVLGSRDPRQTPQKRHTLAKAQASSLRLPSPSSSAQIETL